MSSSTHLDYYRQQSCFSDPQSHVDLFDDLPDDLPTLCQIVRGLYIHYRSDKVLPPMQDRLPEVNLRYMSRILKQIQTLESASLTTKRDIDKRYIGCCRDISLLLCSILRHKGIPARIRIGFAKYIPPQTPFAFTDHVIVEYWHDNNQRWQRADPEQNKTLIQQNLIDFDVLDIPVDQFYTGGEAWLLGRDRTNSWDDFGVDEFVKGRWFVASYLIRDFAALNRDEMLLWDSWGLMNVMDDLSQADLDLLDRMAELSMGQAHSFDDIHELYETESRITLPEEVMNYSPVSKWREEVIDCRDESKTGSLID